MLIFMSVCTEERERQRQREVAGDRPNEDRNLIYLVYCVGSMLGSGSKSGTEETSISICQKNLCMQRLTH